jgi:hypothetical protein
MFDDHEGRVSNEGPVNVPVGLIVSIHQLPSVGSVLRRVSESDRHDTSPSSKAITHAASVVAGQSGALSKSYIQWPFERLYASWTTPENQPAPDPKCTRTRVPSPTSVGRAAGTGVASAWAAAALTGGRGGVEGGGFFFCLPPVGVFDAALDRLGFGLAVAVPPAFFLPPAPLAVAPPLASVLGRAAADGIASPRSRAFWHASAYCVVKSKLACVSRECVALSYTSEAWVSMLCWCDGMSCWFF